MPTVVARSKSAEWNRIWFHLFVFSPVDRQHGLDRFVSRIPEHTTRSVDDNQSATAVLHKGLDPFERLLGHDARRQFAQDNQIVFDQLFLAGRELMVPFPRGNLGGDSR